MSDLASFNSDIQAKSHPYRGVGRGGWLMKSPSWIFSMLQYFEKILPLVESF